MGSHERGRKPDRTEEIPREFACPISGRLMADPVIILSGHSYERSCLQACKNLNVTPPGAAELAAANVVIPNLALQAAIFSWCDAHDHPRPLPLDLPAATLFVYDLPPASPLPSPSASPDGLLAGLTAADTAAQEAALLSLRAATRGDAAADRAALCEEPVLAALQRLLRSRHHGLRLNAAAVVVNLSLHPPNRVRLVRAGLVPALVEALKSPAAEAQDHAAAALFSLAVEEQNRAAVGVLGALPPLLQLVCRADAEPRTRRDAAMALVHLSTAATNVSKLLKLGAVRALLGLPGGGPGGLAVMVLRNLAAVREGREAMVEAGAVQALTQALRGAAEEDLKESCVGTLYALSKARTRFRGMAAAAGLEPVLAALDSDDGGGGGGGGGKKERLRAMARRTLRACHAGEEDEEGGSVSWSVSWSGSWDSGEHGGAAELVGNFSAPVLRAPAGSVKAKGAGAHTTRF
ncbi:U-box domain-containing protein 39-like [Wolffia australiana]